MAKCFRFLIVLVLLFGVIITWKNYIFVIGRTTASIAEIIHTAAMVV